MGKNKTKMIVKNSNKIVSPHGGIVPILEHIKRSKLPQIIRSCFKNRVAQAKYGFEDIIISWILTALCGGTRIEHSKKIKKSVAIVPNLKFPSPDTIARGMKKLSTEVELVDNLEKLKGKKIRYTHINDNIEANRMLIKSTKAIGALKEGVKYSMDVDATFIATLRRGAIRKVDENGKIDYNKIGFNPMTCLIGSLPVFFSMRNGDAGARFQIKECVEKCLNLLEESKIKIGRLVSDAAGYNKELFQMLDERGIKFNVRFPLNRQWKTFTNQLKENKNWRKTEIESANFIWKCEITDIDYKMFDRPNSEQISKSYRVVTMRIPTEKTLKKLNEEESNLRKEIRNKLQTLKSKNKLKPAAKPYQDKGWLEFEGYKYKFFITNDFDRTSEEIVNEYNKRGNAERQFTFLKQDLGMRLPPFSNMNENTVFFIAAALANNVFRGFVKTFKDMIPQLRLNARLPEFQFIFIDVACVFLDNTYIFYNTDIEYHKFN